MGLHATNARRAFWLLAAVGVLVVVLAASLAIGSRPIPLGDVVSALLHERGSDDNAIVRDLRLPRTILGLLAGAAFGVAGGLIQALTRNPLADPGLLGVNAGAAFGVVVGIAVFGVTGVGGYIWFAFAGAVVATVAVYAIGTAGRGGTSPVRLTLAGVAFGAVLSGITAGISLLDPQTFDRMRFWEVGTVAGRSMSVVATIAPFVLTGLMVALLVARPLNAVALGDDQARALGAHVRRTRLGVVVAVTLLCGAGTAGAGPIAFVGLVVPHVARWFVGPDQRWVLPFTAVLTPVLLLVSDVIGRVVARPGELQVGIVTAFVGAPALIWLVRRRRVAGL